MTESSQVLRSDFSSWTAFSSMICTDKKFQLVKLHNIGYMNLSFNILVEKSAGIFIVKYKIIMALECLVS